MKIIIFHPVRYCLFFLVHIILLLLWGLVLLCVRRTPYLTGFMSNFKNFLYGRSKYFSNFHRQEYGRRIIPLLYCDYRLTGNADFVRA
jgi:hypothetical protein